MPKYDELLEDDDESQVVEVDAEPVFNPELPTGKHAGVVVVEPSIITIGRAKRREHLRKLQEESEQP